MFRKGAFISDESIKYGHQIRNTIIHPVSNNTWDEILKRRLIFRKKELVRRRLKWSLERCDWRARTWHVAPGIVDKYGRNRCPLSTLWQFDTASHWLFKPCAIEPLTGDIPHNLHTEKREAFSTLSLSLSLFVLVLVHLSHFQLVLHFC